MNKQQQMNTADIVQNNLYDETKDKRVRKTTDTRRPKLTLKKIGDLRRLQHAKAIEMQQKNRVASRMYGQGDNTSTVTRSVEHSPEGTTTKIEKEYEQVLECWSEQHSFLYESTSSTDLKQQYEQGATLILKGLIYDNNDDSEGALFSSNNDLHGAVEILRQDVHNEMEEFEDLPIYTCIDHSENYGCELKDAFGTLTNVYSSDSKIFGEIVLLQSNENARQVIDLAQANNNKVGVSITFEEIEDDTGTDVIITGVDVVSRPAVSSAIMRLEVKDVQSTDSFTRELDRALELSNVQRKSKF
ncbi:hypothetical protein ACED47_23450 [Vibrio splendidus]|uniref:hypothetical protein n=1 Tax=Vibrio splendidus TaxID=29497 RepID=UPI00352F17B5